MMWYYERQGRPQGPVSQEQLHNLLAAGTIDETTLVWHDGLSDWRPYREVTEEPASDGASVRAAPVVAAVSEVPDAASYRACSQCGRTVASDELIDLGGVAVCGNCKPEVVERLKEGAPIAGRLEYAGFWIRLGAVLLDGVIMTVVNILLYIPLGLSSVAIDPEAGELPPSYFVLYCGTLLVQFIIAAAYEIWFIGRMGATPGKLVCRLRVVQPDGTGISYQRSTGRYFAKMLSGAILAIGYIIAAFDAEKRTLHDHICNTRVTRV